MNIQTIRENVASQCPLTLRLSNGDQVLIPHTDFIMFPPPMVDTILVVDSLSRIHIIDTWQVVDMVFAKNKTL